MLGLRLLFSWKISPFPVVKLPSHTDGSKSISPVQTFLLSSWLVLQLPAEHLEVPWHPNLHKSKCIFSLHQTCPSLMGIIQWCDHHTYLQTRILAVIVDFSYLLCYSVTRWVLLQDELDYLAVKFCLPSLLLPSSLLLRQDLILFCYYHFPDPNAPRQKFLQK